MRKMLIPNGPLRVMRHGEGGLQNRLGLLVLAHLVEEVLFMLAMISLTGVTLTTAAY
jgi:hypothetical protein